MAKLKETVKNMPIMGDIYRELYDRYYLIRMKFRSAEKVFTDIYDTNAWGGGDSVSGQGSDLQQTKKISLELPRLFKAYNVSTMLDVPCGDFFWMKSVDMGDVSYTGADIVEKLIAENSARYGGEKVKFRHLNLLQDNLPKVDLVFCRDCLVHFSKGDVRKALENICKSQSQYLLTTTFTDRTSNADIVTGEWRPLNLEVEPFNLAKPIEVINEDCTQADGIYQDKALGLWRVEDIRQSLG